jgi:hypothetical protein
MIMRIKKSDEAQKLKLPAGAQARHLIETQVTEFLKKGGKVDQIPNGISGYQAAVRQRPVSVEKKPR